VDLQELVNHIDIQDIKNVLKDKKGLIIVGDMQHQAVDQILTYATIHDLPILADPLSQLRKFNGLPTRIIKSASIFK
jgi:2-succinyl-5-enolpyruvyl-6-hydroxy-3-cyclohexene-1-carboxylate synthase